VRRHFSAEPPKVLSIWLESSLLQNGATGFPRQSGSMRTLTIPPNNVNKLTDGERRQFVTSRVPFDRQRPKPEADPSMIFQGESLGDKSKQSRTRGQDLSNFLSVIHELISPPRRGVQVRSERRKRNPYNISQTNKQTNKQTKKTRKKGRNKRPFPWVQIDHKLMDTFLH